MDAARRMWPVSYRLVPAVLRRAVQIGFAGSRQLFEPQSLRAAEAGRLEARVTEYLAGQLPTLPEDLGLEDQHLLCGISQLAIGADTALSRASMTRTDAWVYPSPPVRHGRPPRDGTLSLPSHSV